MKYIGNWNKLVLFVNILPKGVSTVIIFLLVVLIMKMVAVGHTIVKKHLISLNKSLVAFVKEHPPNGHAVCVGCSFLRFCAQTNGA